MKIRAIDIPAAQGGRELDPNSTKATVSAARNHPPRMLTDDEYRLLPLKQRQAYFDSLVAMVPEPPAVPPLMRSMAHEMDRMLDALKSDPSFKLEDLLEKYLGGEAKRGEATKLQSAVLKANVVAVLAVAGEIALQVSSVTDVAALALVFNAVWKGFALGPVQIYHELNDQYDTGARGVEFKMHHLQRAELTKWDDAHTSFSAGKYALPILAATALVNPSAPVAMAILTFCGAMIATMPAHQRSHFAKRDKLSPLTRWLQDIGVISDFAHHDKHHSGRKEGLMHKEAPMRHIGGYDVLSGDMLFSAQDVVDTFDLARRAEAFVYHLTERMTGEGLEPECWTDYPELKAAWLGPAEQRNETLKAGRITRYESTIVSEQGKLDALRAAREPQPALIANQEADLAKMKAQLALFKDPAAQQALLGRHEAAMRALEDFHFKGWERPSTKEALDRAPAEDARLRAEAQAMQDQLLQLAPFLSDSAKPSPRLRRPDPTRLFGAKAESKP